MLFYYVYFCIYAVTFRSNMSTVDIKGAKQAYANKIAENFYPFFVDNTQNYQN